MTKNQPRIGIVSSRIKNNFVYNSCLFEFEDIISEIDNVDLIQLAPNNGAQVITQKIVKKTAQYIPFFHGVKPPLNQGIDLDKEYDLLFIILDFPYNVININLVNQWRQKSKVTVCYLIELWQTELGRFKNHLSFLNNFDFVFFGHNQIVQDAQKIVGRPCEYLAPGVDALKFHPKSGQNVNARSISLTSMGRRSQATHQALLNLAEQSSFFYHYDQSRGSDLSVHRHNSHRTFNANILKNSRYFIAHQAKINCFEQTGGQVEIGYRFFEGAAAGSVLLGTPPKNEVFDEYFGWENSVIPMQFDEPYIADLIADLDRQPDLLQKISNENVANSLRRHDWAYRWQQVLRKVGLRSSAKLEHRIRTLQQLAEEFVKSDEASSGVLIGK